MDVLRRHADLAAFAAPTEEVGEDVVIEIGAAVTAPPDRRSTPAVAHARISLGILAIEVPLRLALGACLVDLTGVIALALVCIANDVVGSIDLLEAVRPSSQLAVGPMMLRLGLFYVGDPHRRRSYVASCLPHDISRHSSSFSLARRAGNLLRQEAERHSPHPQIVTHVAGCCQRARS